jgi:hypothetical protein
MIAGLGRREKRQEFFATQPARNADVQRFLTTDHPAPPSGRLADVDKRLRAAQAGERTRANCDSNSTLTWWNCVTSRTTWPGRRSLSSKATAAASLVRAHRGFLAETQVNLTGSRPGLLRRIRRYLRYGSLQGLDPDDTDVVLWPQRAYYEKRIAKLQAEIKQVEDTLRRMHFDRLVAEHQELSGQVLRAELAARYRGLPRTQYTEASYRKAATFQQFTQDYPVLPSTCHSLRRSIPEGPCWTT